MKILIQKSPSMRFLNLHSPSNYQRNSNQYNKTSTAMPSNYQRNSNQYNKTSTAMPSNYQRNSNQYNKTNTARPSNSTMQPKIPGEKCVDKTELVVQSLKSDNVEIVDKLKQQKTTIASADRQTVANHTGAFYRYSIPQFYEFKKSFSFATASSTLQHPLLNKKLDRHVQRNLLNREVDVKVKGDVTGHKHSTFGQENKPKMRRNVNINGVMQPSRKTEDSGIIRIFLNKTVNLKEAEHAWKPTLFKAKEDTPDQKREIIMLSKFFRSLLNKMTEDNFDILVPEIKKQQVNTSEKLDIVVNMLFEKTISDPGYSSTYAKLCKILFEDESQNKQSQLRKSLIMNCKSEFEKTPENNLLIESIVAKTGELKANLKIARKIADRLNDSIDSDSKINDEVKSIDEHVVKCDDFLNGIAEKFGKKCSSLMNKSDDNISIRIKKLISAIEHELDELDCFRGFLRRRATGTVKFIGELYKVDLLSSKIMFTCIRSLLNSNAGSKTSDENLERLSSLLTTIGSKLDESESRALGEIFNKLQQIHANSQFDESRTGFAIENVIELRSRSWIPRENQRSSEINPMKLEDFAEKMRKQQQQFQNGNYHCQNLNNWRDNNSQRQASFHESTQKYHRDRNDQITQHVPVIKTEDKVSKLTTMPKEDFEKLMKNLLDGKILMEEFLVKMKEFCVASESLMLVMCYYHDRSSSERLFIAKACVALMEQNENSISKEVVSAALDECFELAEDFICDVPKIYEILAEYYCDFRELGFFDKENIEAACNAEKRSKFIKLFNPDGSYKSQSQPSDIKESKVEEKFAIDEKIVVTESSPSLPSLVTKLQDESLRTIKVDSTLEITSLSNDDFSQPPTDKIVGKFENIRKKFEFLLKKNIKKQNLEPLIKTIETENCKHEATFIAELTKEILKTCCRKVKSADKKQIKFLMGNTLDLIKIYVNKNHSLELQCISAIQEYICGSKKQFPGLIATLMEVFFE